VTNAHVARAASLQVRLADGRCLAAALVAADRRADLALLRVPRTRVALASLADSDLVCVGTLVVALGHPLGLRGTVTAGIVHALGPLSAGGRRWIHADLRLAPGNSGGPLADTSGHVVGLNTMIAGGARAGDPDQRRAPLRHRHAGALAVSDHGRAATAVVVARDATYAARLELALRGLTGWRIDVTTPARVVEVARRCPRAVLVLALGAADMRRTLRALRGSSALAVALAAAARTLLDLGVARVRAARGPAAARHAGRTGRCRARRARRSAGRPSGGARAARGRRGPGAQPGLDLARARDPGSSSPRARTIASSPRAWPSRATRSSSTSPRCWPSWARAAGAEAVTVALRAGLLAV
jgi:hypothetical protein